VGCLSYRTSYKSIDAYVLRENTKKRVCSIKNEVEIKTQKVFLKIDME